MTADGPSAVSQQTPVAPHARADGRAFRHRSRAASLGVLFALACLAALALGYRQILWRVVQVCAADRALTGSPFPCLQIHAPNGLARGYAVLRAPFERTHVLVVPTMRVEGIESVSLQAKTAPNYIADAWNERREVMITAGRPLRDQDIGLAVNSQKGRSQDQLHIHVACVQPGFVSLLRQDDRNVTPRSWYRLPFAWRNRRYWARRLPSATLADVNVFATAATLLQTSPGALRNLTFAVLPSSDISANGFYLLADQYVPGERGRGHAEFLLDDNCSVK